MSKKCFKHHNSRKPEITKAIDKYENGCKFKHNYIKYSTSLRRHFTDSFISDGYTMY